MRDTSDTVSLRLLRSEDAPLIAEFYRALDDQAKYYFWPHPLDDEHAEQLAAKAESDRQITLLATVPGDDGELMVGYAYIQSHQEGEAWWFGICVRPGWQEQRVGTRLLGHLLELAREAEVTDIGLHVHLDNPRALKLYRKYGFRETDQVINKSQGVPQYVMMLNM